MKSDQVKQVLSETKLFGDLPAEVLTPLAESFIDRRYKKGETVFRQDDPAEALFIVAEGLVKVYVTSEEGDEMVLVTLGPAEVFGELALIDGGSRSASAEATVPTRLLALSRPRFVELMSEYPAITASLDRSLGAVLRRLTEQAADLVFLDLHGRVAKLLLGLAEAKGVSADAEVELDLNLTQSDLAAMVGGSRQSVNQILQSFQKRGYLEMQGRRIVLKRRDLLRRRASL